MEFFIKKNATLPLLKLMVIKDGRSDYNNSMELSDTSTVFFSMVNSETGIPKITSKPAGILLKTFDDPNTPSEHHIYYKFTNTDTNTVGKFEGQFLIKNEDGNLILPIQEKLIIFIQESFIADDLEYKTCYTSVYPCCFNEPVVLVKEINKTYQLGRQYVPDERDHKYLINNLLSVTPIKITNKNWDDNGWWGNQGNTPQCVGYAWAHWLEDGPTPQSGVAPIIPPRVIYENAQKVDEWVGENYDGTSVRGGVKYLQSVHKVSSYYWGFDLTSLINSVLNLGPVVVGTNWYTGMFYPDRNGLIRISGRVAGGHAYVINGVNTVTKLFRIKNSWGQSWGQSGHAYISFANMDRLIKERGEICFAIEIGS